ncbi:hypothetical protein [Pseudoscardovia suis]
MATTRIIWTGDSANAPAVANNLYGIDQDTADRLVAALKSADAKRLEIRDDGHLWQVGADGTSIDIGLVNDTGALENVIIGKGAEAGSTAETVVAVGESANADGRQSIAVGSRATADGTGSTAVGGGAEAHNARSVALGFGSVTDADDTVSVGRGVGDGSGSSPMVRRITHVGDPVDDTDAATKKYVDSRGFAGLGDDRIAIGSNADASAPGAIAVGRDATVHRTVGVAIGAGANADSVDGVAIGAGAGTSQYYSVALGSGAKATAEDSIAIGCDSIADEMHTVSFAYGTYGNYHYLRRLVGVDAPKRDTDAANKGYVDSAVAGAAGAGGSYTLPPATTSTLGGVRVGDNLTVSEDGTLAATAYTLPTASASTVGGVKIGAGINVASDGTISVSASRGGGSLSVEEYTLSDWSAADGVKIGDGVDEDGAPNGTPSVLFYKQAGRLYAETMFLYIRTTGSVLNGEICTFTYSRSGSVADYSGKNPLGGVATFEEDGAEGGGTPLAPGYVTLNFEPKDEGSSAWGKVAVWLSSPELKANTTYLVSFSVSGLIHDLEANG